MERHVLWSLRTEFYTAFTAQTWTFDLRRGFLGVCSCSRNVRWSLWTWFYCLHGVEKSVRRNTFASAWFCIVHANLSVTAHTASIWITVALSAFRYSMVRRAADGRAATTASAGNNLLRSSSCVPSRALDLDWWLVADV